jgi:glycosyltransferase involved in cell wall biosynthesis
VGIVDIKSKRLKAPVPEAREELSFSSELRLVHEAPSNVPVEPLVAIFLCIFHGKHFLSEQLESIAQQSHQNWRLYVSDDGNCEDSAALINMFKDRFEDGRVTVVTGPNKGFVANFLSLTCDASIDADYFAYSDQDDIWHIDKLEKSIKFLSHIGERLPSLYCSRTLIVDKDNNDLGLSPLFSKRPAFANALVQNIGGGNTMVFNKQARHLAMQAGSEVPVITHDWWMYLLVSGSNGFIKYDPEPSLRYRQHDGNLVGSNISWAARFNRIYMLLTGRFKDYNERNIQSLYAAYQFLSPENQRLLDQFCELRNSNFPKRIAMFRKLKIYRQTIFGKIGLWVAVIFNKL